MKQKHSLEKTDNTIPEHEVLFNFHISDAKLKKLKEMALREDTSVKTILNELITEHIRIHGSNNPNDTLLMWQDPEYKQFPAFKEKITQKWLPYLEKCNEKELQEVAEQSEGIMKHALRIKRNL